MVNTLSPIVLFVYNRPAHTKRTIEALSNNYLASESDLFIFSDAPKNSEADSSVKQVRDFIKTISGFKSLTIIEREANYGLVKSISEGVTDIVNKFGKIIVIEDDLITHNQFLEYMNKGLELYKNHKKVYEIGGYSNTTSTHDITENRTYFLKIPTTWGWATWDDRWSKYHDGLMGIEQLSSNKKMKYLFNYNNSYDFFKLLNDTKKGIVKSWGIVFYWNIFRNEGLTLYPLETMVDQIGFDGSGENSKNYIANYRRIKSETFEFAFPEIIEEELSDRKKIVRLFRLRKLSVIINMIRHFVGIRS